MLKLLLGLKTAEGQMWVNKSEMSEEMLQLCAASTVLCWESIEPWRDEFVTVFASLTGLRILIAETVTEKSFYILVVESATQDC